MGFFSKLFGRIFGEEVGEEIGTIVEDTGKAVATAYLDAAVEEQMGRLLAEAEKIQNAELRTAIIVGIQSLKAALVAAYGQRLGRDA